MSEPNRAAPPPRKESAARKLTAYLKLAADVAAIAMDLRDKPSGMDWFSMAFRATNVGVNWFVERKKVNLPTSIWEYFTSEGKGWTHFPKEYHKIILANAQDLRVADEYIDTDVKLPYATIGNVGKEIVGWGVEGGQVVEGPFFREDREVETYEELGKLMWRSIGGRHLLYAPDGLVLDSVGQHNIVPTAQMRDLLARVEKFLRAKEPRGIMLGGAPGTGKSVTIKWLIGVLGLSSVRIDLGLLGDVSERRGGSVVASMETMLRVLKPDVMVLDDLDRIEVNAPLLSVLERARANCRIVIASANSVGDLMGATTRPGRFDDIIRFDKLDPNVVVAILGQHAHLSMQVEDLPAAYVAEFAIRCRVLGENEALSTLDELRARAEETSLDSDG